MFANMKIGMRLGLGFGVVLVLLAAIAFTGITRMAGVKDSLDKVVHVNNVKLAEANRMRGELNTVAKSVRNLALLTDMDSMKKEVALIQEARAQYDEAYSKLDKLVKTEAGKKIMVDIKADQVISRPLVDKAMELGLANKTDLATAVLMKEVRPAQAKWFADIKAMIERLTLQNNQMVEETNKSYDTAFNLMIALSVISILLGIALAFWITLNLIRTLGGEPAYAADVVSRIAAGDLTVVVVTRANDTSSMMAAIKGMSLKLSQIISDVRSSADNLSSASEQVSATAQSIRAGGFR
jgi:methyl-accepting chemotaxis protein